MKNSTRNDASSADHYDGAENPEYRKALSIYTIATGCDAQMFDCNFRLLEVGDRAGTEQRICLHCTGAAACRGIHLNAIRESGLQGKPYIYQCDLGLMFWTCPIFNENKCSSVLRGSGYLSDRADTSAFAAKCNETISPEEFARLFSDFPSCDEEKIISLAEMLLLCAESLSGGNRKFHEMLRLRSEQMAALSSVIENLKEKYPEGSILPEYSLDKERRLIDSLHKGDRKEAEILLNEVLAIMILTNSDHFKHIQYRALELAVLLARSGIGSANIDNNSRFLKQIQDAKTIEELTSTLHSIVENVSGQISLFQGIPHASAMLKAEQFIRENYTRKINLQEISQVAGLSAPYFSTIFKEEMGENLSRYINRLRVEKASKMLLETDHSLGEISAACCFEDQSWFSKTFKTFTGISPGKFRNRGGLTRRLV